MFVYNIACSPSNFGLCTVMGNSFWNRSFLAFCELKSLFFSTCQVSFESSNWKWKIYPWWEFESSSSVLFSVFCPIDCLHNSLGLTLVDTSCFTCMLGDDLGILFLYATSQMSLPWINSFDSPFEPMFPFLCFEAHYKS